MDIEFRQAGVELPEQQFLRLDDACGAHITCRSGTLWVTQEGVAQDDFLNPGDALTLETAGIALLQAMVPATFVIEAPARRKASRLHTPWFAVLDRLRARSPTVACYCAGAATASSMACKTFSLVSSSGSRVGAASLPAR